MGIYLKITINGFLNIKNVYRELNTGGLQDMNALFGSQSSSKFEARFKFGGVT